MYTNVSLICHIHKSKKKKKRIGRWTSNKKKCTLLHNRQDLNVKNKESGSFSVMRSMNQFCWLADWVRTVWDAALRWIWSFLEGIFSNFRYYVFLCCFVFQFTDRNYFIYQSKLKPIWVDFDITLFQCMHVFVCM